MIIPDGFTQAEPHILCLDTWPPNTLSPAKMAAYKAQEEAGNISLQSIKHGKKSGIAVVRYLSNCPHEWILQQLASKTITMQVTMGELI